MQRSAETGGNHLIAAASARSGDDPIFALNAEAKRRKAAGEKVINATLGALMEDDGRLAILPAVTAALAEVEPRQAAAYAPILGEDRFLKAVVADLFDGTALGPEAVACATPGGSGALALAMQLFLEPGQAVLVPSFYWGPYRTMTDQSGRRIETFEMFTAEGGFHCGALEAALQRILAADGRAMVVLNSPCNNPTGFSLSDAEWDEVERLIRRAAERGRVAVMIDHAYARFNPRGGDNWLRFARQVRDCAQVLVAWTASKSFCQYGGRVGALVALHPDAAERDRLRNAFGFGCRGLWSNCNHAGMLAVGALLSDPQRKAAVDRERARLIELLDARVARFNAEASRRGLSYPRYEGGFFVTVFAADGAATAERMRAQGIFVVPQKGGVRVALCSTPAADVERLVAALAG